ncbi:MAG: glycogen/starch/alpha-glucan phosphorylase [Pseudoflavonifractor sp.]|nr:glycogen/starch/alpha-glucan phosphorylase [Pseudoflavonifractor sp.]MDY3019849.1 glycogen/starch/alpha-glucan phosphorylase [Oscillospiraceae bacterium]
MEQYTKKQLMERIIGKLRRNFGRDVDEATSQQMFQACALVIRDIISERQLKTADQVRDQHERQVHYLSMEFLMGRSLRKNAYNLGMTDALTQAIEALGFSAADLFEEEPDAGLGNGGLGRLAACYLDAATTLDIPITGYTICYELGIFKQKIVDGQQIELPDNWLDKGGAWLITKMDETEEVRFGGTVKDVWYPDGTHGVEHSGYTTVLAVPRDMQIAGFRTDTGNVLRLWDAKSPNPVDMSLYSTGQYLKAVEQQANAEVIAKVLYPEDNHREGKSLRLRQQYFFVSATVQSICRKHKAEYGTLRNFHEKHVLQINDTHPTLAIPELMRILLDQEGYSWEDAWFIVSRSICYTNHTVLAEALERWPQDLMQELLPRIWQIIVEISNRYQAELTQYFHGDQSKLEQMAIIWGHEVRMANLCVCACSAVNGVSALHTGILKADVFRDAYQRQPEKFQNVTNGVDHRRWLSEVNPSLDALIRDCCGGDDYLLHPDALTGLEKYADDKAVLERLGAIKRENKLRFASWVQRESGVKLNTDAMFDVQVKRLHEYKRQLLNAMHIIYLRQQLHANPNFELTPRVYLFGAKAAPGYAVAKEIIHLINSLAATVNADPLCRDKLQVVFLENYRVSMAEVLIPASELSEQISTAGKEASGTSNMKFMMNGALTIGTLDGANVEMHQRVGSENFFLFGLKAEEVSEMRRRGYRSYEYYMQNPALKAVVDQLTVGFDDGVSYADLAKRLLFGNGCPPDEYFLLADFESYRSAQQLAGRTYLDQEKWSRMSLMNIARSGIFAADRSIRDYADNIWHVPHR